MQKDLLTHSRKSAYVWIQQSQNNAILLITEARMRQSTAAAAPPANYVPAPSQTYHEHSILDKAGSIAAAGFLGLLAVAAV